MPGRARSPYSAEKDPRHAAGEGTRRPASPRHVVAREWSYGSEMDVPSPLLVMVKVPADTTGV